MRYDNIVEGKFLWRENRFIAYCEINGNKEKAHVPNTGRCAELFVSGANVCLVENSNPMRKTKYTLVTVWKDEINTWVNIDSQAPNKLVKEALLNGVIPWKVEGNNIFPEKSFGKSRFDFYLESDKFTGFLEVKGVTLEEEGIAKFPDAPTERGVRHLKELIEAKEQGYDAAVCFVIQMEETREFRPNQKMHASFAETLREARQNGVQIFAYECDVEPETVRITHSIPVIVE